MLGKRNKRFVEYRQDVKASLSKQAESKTLTQQENAPNGCYNQSTTPPHERLPPSKYVTLLRQGPQDNRKRVLMDHVKTPKPKESDTGRFAPPKSAVKEEQEVVFHENTPLSLGNTDSNDTTWAMMDFVGCGISDEDGISLLNKSVLSLDESCGVSLPPTTPGNTVGNTPQACLDEWRNVKSSRLVGSSRARKQASQSPTGPGAAFSEMSAHTRIKELEEDLKSAKHSQPPPQDVNLDYRTPAPFRGLSASTSPMGTNGLDPESLFARNQTLANEVRFAEQTCFEISATNKNLEKTVAELTFQVETLQKENQKLQEQPATVGSLETSYKSRVAELETLLANAEKEKSRYLEKCRELEMSCSGIDMGLNREGKLMETILDKERLSKELKDAREQLEIAETRAKAFEKSATTQVARSHSLETENDRLRASQSKKEDELSKMKIHKEKVEEERRSFISRITILEAETDRLSQQRSERESQLQHELMDTRNSNDDLRQQLEVLQQKQTREASESADNERDQLILKAELEVKESIIRKVQSELDDLTSQLGKMTKLRDDAVQKLEEEGDEYTKERAKLSLDLETERQDLYESESKRFSLEEELQTVKKLFTQCQNDKELAESKLRHFQQRNTGLEKEMHETQKVSESLRRSVQEHLSHRDTLQKEADAARECLEEYKIRLSTAQDEARSLRNLAEVTQGQRKIAEEQNQAKVELLQGKIESSQKQIDSLAENLTTAETDLAMAVQKCHRLEEFKLCAASSMQEFPSQLNAFCFEMENLVNGATVDISDRVGRLAKLASTLRRVIVFDDNLDGSDRREIASDSPKTSLDTYSQSAFTPLENAQLQNNLSAESPVALQRTTEKVSPTRTISLELMEEARVDEQTNSGESSTTGDFDVSGAYLDSQASESLSSIADFSHFFSEENLPLSPQIHLSDAKAESVGSAKRTLPTTTESARNIKQDMECSNACLQKTTEENRALKAENLELQKELDSIRSRDSLQVVHLENKLGNIQGLLALKENEIQHLNRILLETEETKTELTEKLDSVRSEVDAKTSKNKKLDQGIENFQKDAREDKVSLKTEPDFQLRELEILRNAKEDWEEEKRCLEKDMKLAEAEMTKLVRSLRETNEELNSLASREGEMNARCRELSEKLDGLTKEAAKEKIDMEQALDKKQRDIERVVCLHQEAEGKVRNLESERDRILDDLGRMKKLVEDRDVDTRRCRDEKCKAVENLERIQSEHSHLNQTIDKLASELDGAKVEINLLQEQCDAHDSRMKSSKMENDELRSANKDMVSVMQDNVRLRQEVTDAVENKNQLLNDLDVSRAKATKLEKDIAKLTSTLHETCESFKKVQEEVKSTKIRAEAAHAEKEEIQAELDSEHGRRERDSDTISALTSANRDLLRRQKELQCEKHRLNEGLDKKSEILKNLERQLASLEAKSTHLEEQLKEKSAEKDATHQLYLECNKAREILVSELKQAKKEMQSLRERAVDAEEKKAQTQLDYSELEKEFNDLQSCVEEKERVIRSLETEVDVSNNKTTELQGIVQETDEKLKAAVVRLESLSVSLGIAEAEKSKVLSTCEKLHSGLELAESTVAEYHHEAEASRARIEQLVYQVESKDEEISFSKKAIKAAEQLTRTAEDQRETARGESSMLRNDIADYRERLVDAEGRLQDSKVKQGKLEESIEQVVEERDGIKSERDKLKEEIDQLREELSRKRSEADNLMEKYQEASDDGAKAQELLADAKENRAYVESELAQLHESLHQKQTEIECCNGTIADLRNKCKLLREYTRKVARKCDNWEIYYENQNNDGGQYEHIDAAISPR